MFPSLKSQGVPSLSRALGDTSSIAVVHHRCIHEPWRIFSPVILQDLFVIAESTRGSYAKHAGLLLRSYVDVSRFYYGEHRKKMPYDSLSSSSSCLFTASRN